MADQLYDDLNYIINQKLLTQQKQYNNMMKPNCNFRQILVMQSF